MRAVEHLGVSEPVHQSERMGFLGLCLREARRARSSLAERAWSLWADSQHCLLG